REYRGYFSSMELQGFIWRLPRMMKVRMKLQGFIRRLPRTMKVRMKLQEFIWRLSRTMKVRMKMKLSAWIFSKHFRNKAIWNARTRQPKFKIHRILFGIHLETSTDD
ncbi:hypothetical protein MMC31_003886, partial [Peltigera leucophlebia]|nr:hypothetical protein [Peltigera leucophlebia]